MDARELVGRTARRCRRLTDEDALAITEYGMLIALVAIGLIAVVSIFGSQISSWFLAKTGNITTV